MADNNPYEHLNLFSEEKNKKILAKELLYSEIISDKSLKVFQTRKRVAEETSSSRKRTILTPTRPTGMCELVVT